MQKTITIETASASSMISEAEQSNKQSNHKIRTETAHANPAHQTKETVENDKFVTTPAMDHGLVTDELAAFKKITSCIDMMDIKAIEKEIGKACKEGAKQSVIAVKASVVVTSYAWITGKLILRAKSLLKKKGEFGDWCQKNLVERGLMSVKTAQRYMAVAKKWDSLDALLAGVPNLWSAYQQAGVLPVPDDADDADNPELPGNADELPNVPPASQVAEYVAEFSKLQKMLRRLEEMGANVAAAVPKAEQDKIDLVIDQIINFATQIRAKSA